MNPRGDAPGDFLRAAVGGAGNPAADRLTEDQKIGRQFPFARASARAGADRVGLVGDEERSVPLGELLRGGPVAVVGQDDTNVGHGRFGEDAGDVVVFQGGFERGKVVELNDPRGFGRVNGRTDVTAARTNAAVRVQRREGLVDSAVVAIVENENLAALGDFARNADREAIGVGGRECKLPERKPEPTLQFFADPQSILRRKHQRDALANLPSDGFGHHFRRVPRHRSRVAQAQIDVFAAIDVDETGALRRFHKNRERPCPFFHPVHRNAAKQRAFGALIEFRRAGMLRDKA